MNNSFLNPESYRQVMKMVGAEFKQKYGMKLKKIIDENIIL